MIRRGERGLCGPPCLRMLVDVAEAGDHGVECRFIEHVPTPHRPTAPLSLTHLGYADGKPIEASLWQTTWHPQGPPTSTQPPRATTFRMTTPPQTTARRATRAGRGAV